MFNLGNRKYTVEFLYSNQDHSGIIWFWKNSSDIFIRFFVIIKEIFYTTLLDLNVAKIICEILK